MDKVASLDLILAELDLISAKRPAGLVREDDIIRIYGQGKTRWTYSGERGNNREVLKALHPAAVEADHLELGERLEVGLVLGSQPLKGVFVKDEVVKLGQIGKRVRECT